MRIVPFHPEKMNQEVRYVHDEVVNLITRSQGPVKMLNEEGALIGPFPPMLHFPQFGIPALSFVRSLDSHATLPKKVREVAILTVGAAFGARFELYAHEIMAHHFGFSQAEIASLTSGFRPYELNAEEAVAYEIAQVLANKRIISDSAYAHAEKLLGSEGIAELIFLIGAYVLLATVLNGFDVPAPEVND
ncbi:carboxymuconolactone decarboxylase family protein [Flavobacterium sp. ANB]|uniref:carboxymuconolactone decarboxylase family protein n=1 Tax=unclassified Flavobacterium TaxID=196869 RepID=UPI0012B6C466|nr:MULTISPECIES: carboxymuconolactone decarboxylase family protein [unclassified Flavobacterium]MBF4516928.1 carboxymuconolactone decarboxylase family protein [Flavobacterium sp. ANB]MTD69176.1 carboxymuconolactone decarboxylase family protein [Flavobacterium sp. LC2016-13]